MSDNFAAEEDWIMLKTIGVGTEVFHFVLLFSNQIHKFKTNKSEHTTKISIKLSTIFFVKSCDIS